MTKSIGELELWEGGFPGPHEFSTLDELDKTELGTFFDAAQRLAEHWQGNQFVGLYLYGQPGTGKTHAAIGLARQLHDEIGAEVHYRFMPQMDKRSTVNLWSDTRNASSLANQASVFPAKHVNAVPRNPKTVLVLDDYQPDKQRDAAAAIEAGAQFGGLVIVTSNYTDPFKLLEAPSAPASAEQIVVRDMAMHADPEAMAVADQAKEQQLATVSESLRSRITAGFKFIEFTGPDHRMENSFWG